MIIVGAGLAGLLAANMLRHYSPAILEKQSSLPNNHSAVLRFRTPSVGDVLNIPFKKVKLIKSYLPFSNPVTDALLYSKKNSSTIRSDRSIIEGTVVADRWIAPDDLIQQMSGSCQIAYDVKVDFVSPTKKPIISTIPMPVLMKALGYLHDQTIFKYREGYSIRAKVRDCEAYVSLLIPDPKWDFSRISITGDELIIEVPIEREMSQTYAELLASHAIKLLGVDDDRIEEIKIKKQSFAKIVPIDDNIRKEFMHWATDEHNIYSLGRFATWRPGLLLDDLIKDIRLINGWVKKGANKYDLAKHR